VPKRYTPVNMQAGPDASGLLDNHTLTDVQHPYHLILLHPALGTFSFLFLSRTFTFTSSHMNKTVFY